MTTVSHTTTIIVLVRKKGLALNFSWSSELNLYKSKARYQGLETDFLGGGGASFNFLKKVFFRG